MYLFAYIKAIGLGNKFDNHLPSPQNINIHTHSHNQTAVNKDLDINESKEKKRTHIIKMSVRLNQVNEY